MDKIKIAIADDESLFRKGVKMILSDYEEFDVQIEAENGKKLIQKLESLDVLPDVLLLDLRMPDMNGIEAAKIIRKHYPSVNIIALSTHFSRAFVINMIELGAAAYLPKNSEPEEVAKTISAVHQNGFHYNKEVMSYIRDNLMSKNRPKAQFPYEITNREKEVLQLICEQQTTPEIAKTLYISPRTVDGHRNSLLSKLGCKNVAGLAIFALRQNLVDLDQSSFL